MQKKILISLILIVALPIALLVWLGLRMAHNEQQVGQAQLQSLVHTQLSNIDEAITGYFYDVQNDLLSSVKSLDLTPEALRNFTEHASQVRHILVLDAKGKRLFPSSADMLSEAEKQFIQRIAPILDNPRILTQGAGLKLSPTNIFSHASQKNNANNKNRDVSNAYQNENGETATAQFGWYVWHWNAELHQLFWWRDAQQRVIAFELSPVSVLSDIIARLPATIDTPAMTNSNTRLINSGGQIMYEWGKYQIKPDEKSIAMHPLSHPMGSWKLEYYAPELSGTKTANSLSILVAALVFGTTLTALAIYLYREHQRELRIAQQRVNFVNQVSHELKTPLTNIRLYAELLETEVTDVFEDVRNQYIAKEGETARKYIAIITTESQRLSRLISNILRFGQLQKTHIELHLQKARVDDIVDSCVLAFTPALQAKGIKVHLDLHARLLVMLDPEALEQILNNLISNAEKYAASGAALQISSTQTSEVSSITVRDFGPGIPTRERARVFQPFYRISSLLSDGVTGTGIGLDIARQLARLHGGDLVLHEVDIGACFALTLRTSSAKEIT